jgi:hypothetical protein
VTDPASRAMDQNGLPWGQMGLLDERLPRRENDVRQSSSMKVVQGSKFGRDIGRRNHHIFGVRAIAGLTGSGIYFVSAYEIRDPFPTSSMMPDTSVPKIKGRV